MFVALDVERESGSGESREELASGDRGTFMMEEALELAPEGWAELSVDGRWPLQVRESWSGERKRERDRPGDIDERGLADWRAWKFV